MALLDVRKRQSIQEVVDRWRDHCLLEDGSLVFDDQQVWTPDNLARLYHNVIEAPLEDDRTFLEKFREQLEGDRGLVLLGAEAMAVYYLFVWIGAVTAATKRERVNEVLSWANEQLHILRNANSRQVADVFSNSPAAITPIIQWPEHGQNNQLWKFTKV
jgi:hypothetical protein